MQGAREVVEIGAHTPGSGSQFDQFTTIGPGPKGYGAMSRPGSFC
jgi:hypothetical protein